MNRFTDRLPGCNGLFLHSRCDARCKCYVFRIDVVGAVGAARLHVQDIDTEALLLDAVVGVDGDSVVVIVADVVLYRLRVNVKLLRIIIDDACVVVKICAAAVVANGRRSDGDSRPIPA